MDTKILHEINHAINLIWEHDIKNDYSNNYLLKEDTLKNALYFHIRNRLGVLLDKYNIRIFTEFNNDKFTGTGYRADMVLAVIDDDSDKEFLGDCIKEYLCIIELKYKGEVFSAVEPICEDFTKTKNYIENMNLGNPQYYIATIWEYPDAKTAWLDEWKDRTNTPDASWAKGKLTELNASYDKDGEMRFYVISH